MKSIPPSRQTRAGRPSRRLDLPLEFTHLTSVLSSFEGLLWLLVAKPFLHAVS